MKGSRRLVAMVSGGAVLLSLLTAVPSAAAGRTVAQVLSATRAAIAREGTVEVSFRAHAGSTNRSEVIEADVGVAEGSETVTLGPATLTLRVTAQAAYAKGNTSGLTTVLGLTSAQAKTVGSRWVKWARGSQQYATLKPDVTFPSVLDLLPAAKGSMLATGTSAGVPAYLVKWTSAANSSEPKLANTLVLTTGDAPLPVEVSSTGSHDTTIVTRLTGWGQPAPVVAPPPGDTIAAAKLSG